MLISERFNKEFQRVGSQRVFITGCTHFGHANIIKFERDSFSNIDEHDDYVVDLINRTVGEDDVLIHLGDIGNPEDMNRIKCKTKFLIKGNHDKRSNDYYNLFFTQVFDYPVYVWKRILLSHEPQIKGSDVLNVHAHLHNSIMKEQDETRDYLNVGIHVSGYKSGKDDIRVEDYKLFKLSDLIKVIGSIPVQSTVFPYEEYASSYKYIKPLNGVILQDNGIIDLDLTRKEKAKRLSSR